MQFRFRIGFRFLLHFSGSTAFTTRFIAFSNCILNYLFEAKVSTSFEISEKSFWSSLLIEAKIKNWKIHDQLEMKAEGVENIFQQLHKCSGS